MKYRYLLWLNALVFCVYLSGYLLDVFSIGPNWNSGGVEELNLYRAFFHHTDPHQFFTIIRPFSIAMSCICVLVFWAKGTPLRVFLIISLAIDLIMYGVTKYYFTPIRDYLLMNPTDVLDPQLVRSFVSKWFASNYIRIALITVGLYTSLRSVDFSYRGR